MQFQNIAKNIDKIVPKTWNPQDLSSLATALEKIRKALFCIYDITEAMQLTGEPERPVEINQIADIPFKVKKQIVELYIEGLKR